MVFDEKIETFLILSTTAFGYTGCPQNNALIIDLLIVNNFTDDNKT